ncbi:Lateral organ boundary [Vigna unguiculata]|uniref:Lateral organ boundary n=1 Tax=Vigna unguiculata TaxID=3917 RepID=A0A4D6LBM3_VIGUN|nr:Lateral organ boundary [Vigna unguiculata]
MSEGHRNVACVLCKYQHRRHDGSCEFGQYFASIRSIEFENACRLFGLAKLLRLMRSAEASERQVMVDSILIEANMWNNDPIHGALGHVLTLNNQI